MASNVRVGDVAIFRVTSAETEAESSTKDDIMQLAGLYSSAGYADETNRTMSINSEAAIAPKLLCCNYQLSISLPSPNTIT